MNFLSNPELRSLFPAKIAAVALSAIAMRADAEDRFARIAASWTKQDLRHVLDDKPRLRFGDDAEDSLANRRSTKKPRFLMRGDTKTNNNSKTKSPDRKPGVNFLKASCPGGESRRWYENPQGLNGP
jgi:hypothetical protein